MAIDPNPKHSPNKVKPAREMAPEGVENTSRPESGGQTRGTGDVDSTPSMRRQGGTTKDGGWSGPTKKTAGSPPAD